MANGLKLAKFVDEQRHSAIQAGKSPFDLARNPLSGAWRLATQWVRHLPTTVIVGAQDAGATQLYASMEAYSCVAPASCAPTITVVGRCRTHCVASRQAPLSGFLAKSNGLLPA